jgi:hypothetical protein
MNRKGIALVNARADVEESNAGIELRDQGIATVPKIFCAAVSVYHVWAG